MEKLTILIDMDDTIENLCETWVEYLNELYGTNVSTNDIKEWDMTKAFPMLTSEEIYTPLTTADLWKRVKPLPYAVGTIRQLIDDGHKVVIVTASSPETIKLKLHNVLFKYFPYLTYKDVIVTSQKQLIKGDVLIDDAPHNLKGFDGFALLFNAPHNRSYKIKDKCFYRVNDWQEIYQKIQICSAATALLAQI